MFESEQFELLDFGNGRKLEKFNGQNVIRDCPAAENTMPRSGLLQTTVSQIPAFDKSQKAWSNLNRLPENWRIQHNQVIFRLKPTPFGHVGVFAEQAENWAWLTGLKHRLTGLKALNLFAYTGGTTLTLAGLGANVTHVDSAKNVVTWARENAILSSMEAKPVRWLVEDAMKFCIREAKRGNHYDILVADPPAFGHGAKNATWKFDRDIGKLLALLAEISSSNLTAVLITCHNAGTDSNKLAELVAEHFDLQFGQSKKGPLDLATKDGRKLNCGHFFRWHRNSG